MEQTLTPVGVTCPGCNSPNILHRGGKQRQCAVCRFRFTIDDTGKATNPFTEWLGSRKTALTKRKGAAVR